MCEPLDPHDGWQPSEETLRRMREEPEYEPDAPLGDAEDAKRGAEYMIVRALRPMSEERFLELSHGIPDYSGPDREAVIARMLLVIEVEQETDGRWIAEITELPGVMAYGDTAEAAVLTVSALAEFVLADADAAHSPQNLLARLYPRSSPCQS